MWLADWLFVLICSWTGEWSAWWVCINSIFITPVVCFLHFPLQPVHGGGCIFNLTPAFYSSISVFLQCDSMTAFQRKAFITSSLTCECLLSFFTHTHTQWHFIHTCGCGLFVYANNSSLPFSAPSPLPSFPPPPAPPRVTGGELFEDIVAREYYSEADAR